MITSKLVEVFVLILAPPGVLIANWVMRKHYPKEIYIVWYVFFLVLVIFIGLEMAAARLGVGLPQLCGPYENACQTVHDYLTNFDDEVRLLISISVLTLGPQLLTYLVSGLFGAATAPKFVLQIEQFVIWSFVKFTAGLAGVRIANAIAAFAMTRTVDRNAWAEGTLCLFFAFSYAGFHCFFTHYLPNDLNYGEKRIANKARRLHRFLTRYTRRD